MIEADDVMVRSGRLDGRVNPSDVALALSKGAEARGVEISRIPVSQDCKRRQIVFQVSRLVIV